MASDTWIQTIVHRLEEGEWKTWVRRALVAAFVLFVITLWMYRDNGFKGLSHEKAMEQAQISREIQRGNGFSTKMIRPAALYQFRENTGSFTVERTPDAYHAPLNPIVNAVAFLVADELNKFFLHTQTESAPWHKLFSWANLAYSPQMKATDIVYAYDRIIVLVQFAFMIGGWLVSYLTMKRLFDKRLAVLGAWMLILCQTYWDFALSGLPQNVLFFFSAIAIYCLVRAVEKRVAALPAWRWLLGSSVAFGFMALTHGLALWILGGALLFVLIYFPRRWVNVATMLGVVALMYSPWLVRNYKACGNPLGLGWYSGLSEIKGSESAIMRSMEPPFERVSPAVFRVKVQSKVIGQAGEILKRFGGIIVAPVFFLALLHVFKRPETSHFRWAVLSMWLFAVCGMSAFGLEGPPVYMPFAPPVEANDLYLIFMPLFVAYGLALVLVMWTRLEIHIRLVRFLFLSVIFILSGLRFFVAFVELNQAPRGRVQWPPYVPPIITVLRDWTTDSEIIASDMPWAVAWYADRKSLWLPISVRDFIELNDYNWLSGKIVGMYLTPITGNRAFISEILKGEYREWSPFITRQVSGPGLRDFPLRAVTSLPIDNECVFYADRDRWTPRDD